MTTDEATPRFRDGKRKRLSRSDLESPGGSHQPGLTPQAQSFLLGMNYDHSHIVSELTAKPRGLHQLTIRPDDLHFWEVTSDGTGHHGRGGGGSRRLHRHRPAVRHDDGALAVRHGGIDVVAQRRVVAAQLVEAAFDHAECGCLADVLGAAMPRRIQLIHRSTTRLEARHEAYHCPSRSGHRCRRRWH
jgi:hypothetical protein